VHEEIIGQPVAYLSPTECPDETPTLLQRPALSEHAEQFETVRVRKDGVRIDAAHSTASMLDGVGRVAAVATIARDITGAKRAAQGQLQLAREEAQAESARQRKALLAETSRRLVDSLDLETTLREIAELAIAAFADSCGIRLDGDAESHGQVAARAGPIHDDLVLDAETLACETGSEHRALRRRVGSRSTISVPLMVRGRTLGAISFVRSKSAISYSAGDLRLAEAFCGTVCAGDQ
jgi:hypothetical protein